MTDVSRVRQETTYSKRGRIEISIPGLKGMQSQDVFKLLSKVFFRAVSIWFQTDRESELLRTSNDSWRIIRPIPVAGQERLHLDPVPQLVFQEVTFIQEHY